MSPIQHVIAWSAKNRYLVLLLFAALTAFGIRALREMPLDAIPDLSDTQVIVYSRWDRSPNLIEDQVTYPIITALLGAPKVKVVRGFSDFGYSYVYVIFEDGTDLYFARTRVLEYLSKIQNRLPQGVRTELGPDASGVGWVYEYALVDEEGIHGQEKLRSYQDWFLRYALQSVQGVAEVATVGGAVKEYQVTIDPNQLSSARLASGLTLAQIASAIRRSNSEVGGRLLEVSGKEFMVRGRGYISGAKDIEAIVLGVSDRGTPLTIGDIAKVGVGPDLRRGIADLNGKGDVVGGIVVMRHGENALSVIRRVKERLAQVTPSLPKGVKVVTTYDRSELIERAIDTLRDKLLEEMVIVSLVILLFLWHIPSAIVPIVTIPLSVLLAFVPMALLGIGANLMSLSGIAISIGVLVDGAIVEVENAYKKLEAWLAQGGQGDPEQVRLAALLEVGPSVFFSLLLIAVAFLPVFTLVDQEGRLFRPLAYSKNLAMAIAALLAVTLDPALRMMFTRLRPFHFRPRPLRALANGILVGTYHKEEKHPVSKVLFAVYEPACRWVLRHPYATVALSLACLLASVPPFLRLGSEFMPPLYEGSILYMPSTLPGISTTEAGHLLKVQDRILKSFPEVASVFGKAGRADTATDPAPLSMMETTVVLHPESTWRKKERFYSKTRYLPGFLKDLLRQAFPEHISPEELISEMDRALRLPGTTNAWTMPIKARIDMLATGVRTPLGIKVNGADLKEIERIGEEIAVLVRKVPATRSVFAEKATGGYFVDFDLRREALSRYGLTVDDVNEVILGAIGGESVTTTIEGRERYSVSVRYPRELRENIEQLGRVLVPSPLGEGAQVPLAQLADLRLSTGPSMIRDENGMLAAYVYVDLDTSKRDLGGYVEDVQRVLERVKLPQGYALHLSGQYENLQRVRERLTLVVPLTLLLIALLLYLNTGSLGKVTLVLLAVPFSAIGAVWILYLLHYNLSIAVWVGVIALLGLDAETGVFMLLYLDLAIADAKERGRLATRQDLIEAIIHGAVKRVRPKAMTVCAAMIGLSPILWSQGTGADLMKRIAAPMVGGLFSSFLLELLVYPAVYFLWLRRSLP